MALPAMWARPRRSVSPSIWSRCVRMFIATVRVGRAGADEQQCDYRVRADAAGAGSKSHTGRAPNRTALHRTASW